MRLLLPALLLLTTTSHAQSWQQLPDFLGTARDDASAFVIGSDIYVGTGMEVGWAVTNDWYRYDAVNATWQQVASLPANGRQYCTAFSIDGTGYLFGGTDGTNLLNALWAYDPTSNSWNAKAALPAAGRSSSSSFVIAGQAYIVLGRYGPDDAISNACWRYDRATDTWEQRASYPGAGRLLANAFSDGTFGYVIGGQDSSATGVADGYRYDPVADEWTSIPDLPGIGRFDGFGAFGTTHGFMLGGTTNYDPCCLAEAWSYDPTTTSWTAMTGLPNGDRKGGVAAFVPQIGLFMGTGLESGTTRHQDWWLLATDVGISEEVPPTWTLVPNPGTESFTLSGTMGTVNIHVTDTQGRNVIAAQRNSGGSIDAQGWCKGLYLVTVTDAAGRSYRVRWIKQ